MVFAGEGKRSRLLGTIGVTRGFGGKLWLQQTEFSINVIIFKTTTLNRSEAK